MKKYSESQRKTLALLLIALVGYFYIETILTPYMQKKNETGNRDATSQQLTPGELGKPGSLEQSAGKAGTALNSHGGADPVVDLNTAIDPGAVSEDLIKQSESIEIENENFKMRLSLLGGVLTSLELKNHRSIGGLEDDLYQMISHDSGMSYPGALYMGTVNDGAILYRLVDTSLVKHGEGPFGVLDGAEKGELVLEGEHPNGSHFKKVITFYPKKYHFNLEAEVSGISPDAPLSVSWTSALSAKEREASGMLDAYEVSGFVSFDGDLSVRLPYSKMIEEGKRTQRFKNIRWLGIGNRYFATAIIDPEVLAEDEASTSDGASNGEEIQGLRLQTAATAHLSNTYAQMLFSSDAIAPSGSPQKISTRIYSGPKSYTELEDEGFGLKRLVDLGMTGFISGPLLSLLKMFYKLVNNYGLAIVLLTIAVKLCLYPVNTAQYKSMKAMQAIKPELDRIKENIKDPKQAQIAQMELFKKKGVNPLGGCLPAFIQMPIFIGLYSALMLAVELRHAPFGMWVTDLSAPDRVEVFGVGIPVLVVLFTVSIMIQQWTTPSTMEPAQKKAMMFVPIVMFFMFMSFPAGLALYWLTNNLISIGQQQAIQYTDKSGKSGLWITLAVAGVVFLIALICTQL